MFLIVNLLSLESRYNNLTSAEVRHHFRCRMEAGENQLVRDMTYIVEQFVRKIKSPVTVRIGDKELHFASGNELAVYEFENNYEIIKLEAADSAIVVKLAEKNTNVPFNYAGEAALK